jgi:DNA polymerase III alpha subunit (gram-positive type)
MSFWIVSLLTSAVLGIAILRTIRQQDIAVVEAARVNIYQKQRELSQTKKVLKLTEREWALAFGTFSAVDIETTGLSNAKSKIIQIAIVEFVGGRASGTWSTYINPGIRIPTNATKVNNITNEMVTSAPFFTDVMHVIQRQLDTAPLVAHNMKFDTDFLIAEFAKQNVSWIPKYGYCTMRMAWGAPIAEPPLEERKFYNKRERRYVTYKVRDREPWLKLGVLMML